MSATRLVNGTAATIVPSHAARLVLTCAETLRGWLPNPRRRLERHELQGTTAGPHGPQPDARESPRGSDHP